MLRSMSLPFLRLIVEGKCEVAQETCGFIMPPGTPLPGGLWLKRRITLIEHDGEQHSWMYRAIIRKDDKRMVGYINFHHKAPDPDLLDFSRLAVELGYTIHPDYRRRGYAKESAIAMMEWANRESNVRTFILNVSPANSPSMHLAQAMNFKKIGERIDEFDGLEYTMRAEIEDVLEAKHAMKRD